MNLTEKLSLKMWAKTNPYHTLYQHMIDVGCVCAELLENSSISSLKYQIEDLLGSENIINTVSFIAALHDIGKCHPEFQGLDQGDLSKHILPMPNMKQIFKGKYRHESGSCEIVFNRLKDEGLDEKTCDTIGTILQLHHARTKTDTRIRDEYSPNDWYNCQEKLFCIMSDVFRPDFAMLKNITNYDSFATLMWGITILSDWIASSEDSFCCKQDRTIFPKTYYKQASEIAKNAIKKSGLESTETIPSLRFTKLFAFLNLCDIRPLQKSCIILQEQWEEKRDAPLLTIIEAPMGEGKTESAIFLAANLARIYKKSGIYFALPTSATSNQMVERISCLLEAHGLNKARLLHSTAWLIDEYTKQIDHEDNTAIGAFTAPLRRGILSQYAVGTVDQIMLSVMNIRFGILRLIGAASKVIVIDEVHAYDQYMFTIIKRLLEWCKELCIPVILLSATLPESRKAEMLSIYGEVQIKQDYPLITLAGENGIQQKVVEGTAMKNTVDIDICPVLDDVIAIANLAVKQAGAGSVCVIMNTVDEAVDVYKAIKTITQIPTMLFHARFTVKRRNEIEKQCIDCFGKESFGSRNTILVATQVVEQSLDIDFDVMLSAVAPIDLLLQRMGRLHRHTRSRPAEHKQPRFYVLALAGDRLYDKNPSGFVYSPYILNKTLTVLERVSNIHLPQDIRQLIESVYAADYYDDEYIKCLFGGQIQKSMGESVTFPSPHKDYFFHCETNPILFDEGDDGEYDRAVSTRLGEPSMRILLIDSNQIKKDEKKFTVPTKLFAKEIFLNTVTVRARKVEVDSNSIKCAGLLQGVTVLPISDGVYHGRVRNKPVSIYHDNELGLIIEEEKSGL